MIFREDIQRLIHRPEGGRPVLSVFLDMSVTSENKRTYGIFLSQSRTQFTELDSDRMGNHREAIGQAFERVEKWLDESFEESNKGVALYAEIGGDWFEALQFPVPVRNRMVVSDDPVIGPLAQIVETYHHHGVMLVDREHLRMMSVYLGEPLNEHEVRAEPYPTRHDIQRGGYAAKDYQKRKAEEVRHFFKEFALEVGEFARRYRPDDLIVLGTEENVSHFLEFLPAGLREDVVHTANAPVDATATEVLERLEPFMDRQRHRRQAAAAAILHDRVRNNHFATGGLHNTLEQLQEGKVDTLVVAREAEHAGARCLRCGFYLTRRNSGCPYCGGEVRDNVDLVEAMIRMAEEQEVPIEFVEPQAVVDFNGVGALLKF